MKSQAHDVTDSSLDEFTGFHPTDIASSDTKTTDNSITISDDDDDDSTSHTTTTAEFLDADDNLSNFSNAVQPSVAESDDITVTFSDGDGMSEEISIQTVGNAVPPCHDGSTDDFSNDEIEKKLLLIRHVPNQIKEIQGSYCGGRRVGKYPTCFKKKKHSIAEIPQTSVEDNYYEEEAENIESNSDDNNHVEPDEKEAENIENNSGDNDHVQPNEKEAENIENHSIHGDEQAEFPQGQPDENEAENIQNHSIHRDDQAEFPQGQPDEKEAENIQNHSIHGDEQAEFPQGQPDKNEAENIENHSIHGDDQVEFPQGQPDEKEAENIENHSIHGDDQAELPQQQPDIEKQDDSHNGSDDNGHLDLELQPNNSSYDHDDCKEMENKNDFPETPITNIDPENELLNAKRNITSKKETEDRKRKSSRLAAKSKATENKEKEDRKRKSQTSPAKSNKKLKQEEMLDDGDIL